MKDNSIKATGNLVIELFDQDGNLKDKREVKNLVVSRGREFIAARMAGTTQAVMSHMAVGTGTGTPSATNLTLGNEVSRVALGTTTLDGTTVKYTATFNATQPNSAVAITEAGIFNSDQLVGSAMLCRTTFNPINKSVGDVLTINWNVTINASA